MKPTSILVAVALLSVGGRAHADPATSLFACRIGTHTVSVTDTGGQLSYRYGTAGKDEMRIVAATKSGKVFQMQQRFADPEYQLRFENGAYSYVVFSMEGNGRSGAQPVSGLVVMKGTKVLSNKFCSPYEDLTVPPSSEDVPEDSGTYSAM